MCLIFIETFSYSVLFNIRYSSENCTTQQTNLRDRVRRTFGHKITYRVFKRIQKLLGLPEQRLHDLSAYTITHLLSWAISPHEVSDRVGAKTETLMKHYASMKPERRILIAKQSRDRLFHKLHKFIDHKRPNGEKRIKTIK